MTNKKQIQKVKEQKNISSLMQDKARSLDSKTSQARDRSQIGLSNTNIINKKNKGLNVTPMVKNFSQDLINNKKNTYINFSIYNNCKRSNAAVTLVVRDRSDESDLLTRGIPGSNPGRSAPLVFSNQNQGGTER